MSCPQPPEPFTYAEIADLGITPAQLRTDDFVRVHRGCYVAANAPPDDHSAFAWLKLCPPGTALYGPTAAAWYGLPVKADEYFHVIVPGRASLPRGRDGLKPHEGMRDGESTVVRGVRVTSPERTWLDLALTLRRDDLVAAGDAMVRRGLTTPDKLVEAADGARRRRGIVKTRTHARLVREKVDSHPETRVRLILHDRGITGFVVNPDVFDEAGGWIGRPDLGDVELLVALQYEGDGHRTSQEQWRKDVARDSAFADNGWEVVRLTARDLLRPNQLCSRVENAQRRQRARKRHGL